jgi:membrane protease YdiL (CAAX protease family)
MLWLALVFAMIFPTFLALVHFVYLAHEGDTANPAQQLAYALGKVIQFAFPLLCLALFEHRFPRPNWPSYKGLALGVGFGVGVAAAMLLLYYAFLRDSAILARTPLMVRQKLVQFGVASPWRFAGLALFVSVLHSLLEEYYWRWFVFRWLPRLVPWTAAVAFSSLAFMAHHVVVLGVYLPGGWWTGVVPLSLCVAAGGAVWAWLYDRTGSIYAPWVSHLLVDVGIFLIGYDLCFLRS